MTDVRDMTDHTATLTVSDGTPSITFPTLSGTIGPDVIDIRTLYSKSGKFTYDPGFLSTQKFDGLPDATARESSSIAGIRSSSSRSTAIFWRRATCSSRASCRMLRRRRSSFTT